MSAEGEVRELLFRLERKTAGRWCPTWLHSLYRRQGFARGQDQGEGNPRLAAREQQIASQALLAEPLDTPRAFFHLPGTDGIFPEDPDREVEGLNNGPVLGPPVEDRPREQQGSRDERQRLRLRVSPDGGDGPPKAPECKD